MQKQIEDLNNQRHNLTVSIRRAYRDQTINNKRKQNTSNSQGKKDQYVQNVEDEFQNEEQDNKQFLWENRIITMRDFITITQLTKSNHSDKVIEGLFALKKLMKKNNDSIKKMCEENLFPFFIKYAQQNENIKIKTLALDCLINSTAISKQASQYVINQNGQNMALQLLTSQHKNDYKFQAIWLLSNLVSDSIKIRNYLLDYNIVPIIIFELVSKNHKAFNLQTLIWALSNVCRGNPSPQFQKVKDTVPIFCQIIKTGNLKQQSQMISESTWALSYIVQNSKKTNQIIISCGLLPKIGECLTSPLVSLVVPALRIIGNIFSGSKQQQQAAFQPIIYKKVFQLIYHQHKQVKRQSTWVISNMSASTQQISNHILKNQKLILKLVQLFGFDAVEIRVQIAYIFLNLTQNNLSQQLVKTYNSIRVMQAFVSTLKYIKDPKNTHRIIDIIFKLLTIGDSLRQELGNNPFKNLFDKAGGKYALQKVSGQSHDVFESLQQLLNKFYN